MTQAQHVAKRQRTEPADSAQTQSSAQAREPEYTLAPPADVVEDADGVRILLDMPGVSKDRLSVKADNNELVVEGEAEIDMPKGMQAAYAEIRSTRYRRSFTLTRELEADGIEASIKDGVLAIRIPKRAELKPRRIEIQTA
jgi:HSP20 family protein